MKLDGRVALVTGGGGDIGRSIATTLSKAGAAVVVNDCHREKAERVASEIAQAGGESLALQADVSCAADVNAMFGDIARRFGRIDILVNNAGISIRSSLKFHEDDDWDKVIRVNLYSVFYCSRAALHLMIKQKSGCIISISSMLSFYGSPFDISYVASKGGINSFTKSLAREGGRHGIRVNAICPALIDTEMSQNNLRYAGRDAKAIKEMWAHLRPIERELEPQDVANVALFLASDEAGYVNGQLIRVDGGMW